MKKYLLMIPIVLFHYLLVISVFLLPLSGELANPLLLFAGPMVLISIACLMLTLSSIIIIAFSLKNKWSARTSAKFNMILKLIQIPGYIVVFIMGLAFLNPFLMIFTIIFALLDLYCILCNGIISLALTYRANAEGKINHPAVYGITQFLYCIDVISAIVMFVKVRKAYRSDAEIKE